METVGLESRDFWIGDWSVLPKRGRIQRGDRTVRVTPRAMAVLVYLAESNGAVVSRNTILDAIWPRADVTADALSQCIVELRRAFRDDPKNPRVIETIPKRGVRLIPRVSLIAPAPAAPGSRQNGSARSAGIDSASHLRLLRLGALAVLVIALGAIIFWPARNSGPSEPAGTNSPEALALYQSARDYFNRSNDRSEELRLALLQFQRATEKDPAFAEAWARLGVVHTAFFWFGIDRSPERLASAERAIDKAFELSPGLGEAHLARANFLHRGRGDYEAALAEFAIAEQLIPNDPDVYFLRSSLYRRIGEWGLAIREIDRALDIDSSNIFYLRQQHTNFLFKRDYARAEEYLDKILVLRVDDATTHVDRAALALFRDGDTSVAHGYSVTPPPVGLSAGLGFDYLRWLVAYFDRDCVESLRVLDGIDADWVRAGHPRLKSLLYARTHRLCGNDEQARAYDESTVAEMEKQLAEAATEEPNVLLSLAEAQAGLGQREIALESLKRARNALPKSNIGPERSDLLLDGALGVLLPLRELDRALHELDTYLRQPGYWSIEGLANDPRLYPIRDDPRFRALLEEHGRE